MARPISRRVYLKYSGEARYLQLLIEKLQKQYDASLTFDGNRDMDKQVGYSTVTAKVELNIPGLKIELEEEEDIDDANRH